MPGLTFRRHSRPDRESVVSMEGLGRWEREGCDRPGPGGGEQKKKGCPFECDTLNAGGSKKQPLHRRSGFKLEGFRGQGRTDRSTIPPSFAKVQLLFEITSIWTLSYSVDLILDRDDLLDFHRRAQFDEGAGVVEGVCLRAAVVGDGEGHVLGRVILP